jgi:hypothetical protein
MYCFTAMDRQEMKLATGILNLSGSEPSSASSSTGLNGFLGISQTALDIDLGRQHSQLQWQFLSADSLLGDYAFIAINGVVTNLQAHQFSLLTTFR